MEGEARCCIACDLLLFWEKEERRSLCIRNGDVISRENSVLTEALYNSLRLSKKIHLIIVASMVSHIIVQIKNLHIFIHHLFVRKHFPETNLHLSRPFLLVKGLFMS